MTGKVIELRSCSEVEHFISTIERYGYPGLHDHYNALSKTKVTDYAKKPPSPFEAAHTLPSPEHRDASPTKK